MMRRADLGVRNTLFTIVFLAYGVSSRSALAQTPTPTPVPLSGFVSCAIPLPTQPAQPAAVASGDFDHDGVPDLAVVDLLNNRIVILLANRSLFRAGDCVGAVSSPTPQVVTVNGSPVAIAAGDLEEKGNVDLAAVGPAGITILTNNGNGQFTANPTPISAGASPSTVAIADVDGDSHLDIVVGSGSDNSVTVVYGRSGGGFDASSQTVKESVASLLHVAFLLVADVSRHTDNALDIVVGSGISSDPNVYLLVQNKQRSVPTPHTVSVETVPVAIATGDFNQDDWPDLAVVGKGGSLQLFLNDGGSGGGTAFTAAGTPVTAGSDPSALAVDDFNGDGKLDVVVADQAVDSSNRSTVSFFLGDGQGNLIPAPQACGLPNAPLDTCFVGAAPAAMILANLDGGSNDVITANSDAGTLSVLLSSRPAATPTFTATATATSTGTPLPSSTPTGTPTDTPTPTSTPTPTPTRTPPPTFTFTVSPTPGPQCIGGVCVQGQGCRIGRNAETTASGWWLLPAVMFWLRRRRLQ